MEQIKQDDELSFDELCKHFLVACKMHQAGKDELKRQGLAEVDDDGNDVWPDYLYSHFTQCAKLRLQLEAVKPGWSPKDFTAVQIRDAELKQLEVGAIAKLAERQSDKR